jgi:NitT/TauT family transport system substrate-binding protein
MQRWTKQVSLAALALLAVTACGSSATPSQTSTTTPYPVKIMVGGLSKQIYLPNMLTQQLGYFKEQNLDVTLVDEQSGVGTETMVLAGAVDAGSGSYNHTLELQAQGKFMETVVQLQIAPGEAEMVDAKKAGSIKTAADLKGKTLGVTELGSGTHTLTLALLGKAGIAGDQANFVGVGAGDTFIAAMQNGKIDAGMTTEPTISRLIKSGVGTPLVDLRTPASTRAALGGDYPFISVWLTTDYVKAHKPIVQRIVNAYVKTLKWIASHSAQEIADKMPADYYAGDKALYVTALAAQKDTFSPDGKMPSSGPPVVADIEAKYISSMKGKTVDLSKTYTNDFVTAAT